MKPFTLITALLSSTLLTPTITTAEESSTSGVMLIPDEIQWKDNPRVPGLGVARIQGHAKEKGPFIHRVRFPKGRVVQAHSHPDDRTYTVLSGTWYIGWGGQVRSEQADGPARWQFLYGAGRCATFHRHSGR